MIKVGIIGYGLSAKVFQIPYILASADFELYAIVQRSGDEAEKDHETALIYRSAQDLFLDPAVDVVIVSTPPSSHFELVAAALNAGKHVVVEKPFCPSSKECNELIDLAKTTSRILTVYQNRRWDADFVTLQKILEQGQLGRIVELESHFDRYDPVVPASWAGKAAPGGGVIYDLGTHLIDQILVVFGLPSKVTGFLDVQRSPSSDGPQDTCTVLLHYDSGLVAMVRASAVSATLEQPRYTVRGYEGSFSKHHLDPQEEQLVGGMSVKDSQFGVEDEEKAGLLVVSRNGSLQKSSYPNVQPPTYMEFYTRLANSLAGRCEVPVTAKDARNVIRLVELAIESSERGVTLPVIPEEFSYSQKSTPGLSSN